VLLALAYALPFWFLLRGQLTLWALLPAFSLPLAVNLARRIRHETGAALNRVLADTARLLLCFGVLLAASLMLGAPASASLPARDGPPSHG